MSERDVEQVNHLRLFYAPLFYFAPEIKLLSWQDALTLAGAFLGGLLIPFIGLVSYLVKIASRLQEAEGTLKEMVATMDKHVDDRRIHVDPDRDGARLGRIEAEIKELIAKMDALLRELYSRRPQS